MSKSNRKKKKQITVKDDSLDKIDKSMEELMGFYENKKPIPKLAREAKKIIKHKITRSEAKSENTLLVNPNNKRETKKPEEVSGVRKSILEKIFEKNLENKDKLMEEDIKKWRKASTLEEKEVH